MFIGTHACIPLVVVGTVDLFRLKQNKKPLLKTGQLVLIAIAGILPDLLWPHMSRQARLSSWTHTIWFLTGAFPVIYLIAKKTMKNGFMTFVWIFWLAIALHILTDMLSGGASLLYPIEKVFGGYYIPYPLWLKSDIVIVTVTVIIFAVRYYMLKMRIQKNE